MTDTTQPRVLFLSGDLVFASRVRGVCTAANADLYFGGNLPPNDEKPAELVRYVILDLATRSKIATSLVAEARAKYPQATLVAYAPHVHRDALQQANEAGYDVVFTRGQFDAWLTKLASANLES